MKKGEIVELIKELGELFYMAFVLAAIVGPILTILVLIVMLVLGIYSLSPVQAMFVLIFALWLILFIFLIICSIREQGLFDNKHKTSTISSDNDTDEEQSTLLFLELGFAKRRDLPNVYERIMPANQKEMSKKDYKSIDDIDCIYYEQFDGRLINFELNGYHLSYKMHEAIDELIYEKGLN